MAWKVKVYTYNKPEEEEDAAYVHKKDADSEAEQINLMQPEGCENLAVVVECDDEGREV